MNDLKTIILALVVLVLPEALVWYFLPFWYAWALGLFFGLLWTHGILFLFNGDGELQGTHYFWAGMIGVLNLPSVFLAPANGVSFSIWAFLTFTSVILLGFSNLYRANFRQNESQEEQKEKEVKENKEWEDKKW
jgi:hypothetical protein